MLNWKKYLAITTEDYGDLPKLLDSCKTVSELVATLESRKITVSPKILAEIKEIKTDNKTDKE